MEAGGEDRETGGGGRGAGLDGLEFCVDDALSPLSSDHSVHLQTDHYMVQFGFI